MHPNQALIREFYSAFAERDGDRMAACYAADATFEDPAFVLEGDAIGAMWKMLCERGGDALRIEYSGLIADEERGAAHWEAWYPFGPARRPVHNIVDAEFTFIDGKIATHRDHFDFYRWSKMALGAPGLLLGWSPVLPWVVRRNAAKQLASWRARRGV